ncbi:MAG: CDP-glycerol glycerophosphotransferase family protein [bacterium]
MTYRALFVIGHTYHRASLDPIYLEMKRRGIFEIYFTCTEEKERKYLLFTRSLKKQVEARLRSEGIKTTDRKDGFDVVITGDIFKDASPYGNALLCFINHGTGIKTILYRLLSRHKDTQYNIFVEGEYRKKRIQDFGVQGCSQIHVVGYPKLDPIFRGELDREAIIKKWNLDPNKPTVLFAPTYKPTCLDRVREQILPETVGYNLIIKLHPYSWLGKYAPHWHHRIYEKAIKDYPHARLIPPTEHNILPFIYVADTMISEASSTIFEFLALGKIGIIFDLPCEKLKHHDGMPLLDEDNRYFLGGAFLHIDKVDQIRAAIENALNPSDMMRDNIENLRKKLFFGLDGLASERIVNKIIELLEARKKDEL